MGLVLTCVQGVWAHEGDDHPPRKVTNAEAHRPTPLPDRIFLTWTGDPATTQAVTWRTDSTITKAWAEIAVATDGPEFVKQATRVPAATQSLQTDLAVAHYHTVEFQQLTPATVYVYRVGDSVNWSEWIQFRTASTTPEPFSFVYFGDAQTDLKSHWSRVVREAFRDSPQMRLFLHAGDLVNNANSDGEWGEWFQAAGWANGMIPSIVVPGNHEYFGRSLLGPAQLSRHWRPQFALPLNGPEKFHESTYWIDYQGVRFVALNSNLWPDEQAPWLEKVLSTNPQRWTIVTFHHPIFSAARNRDNPVLREAWKPLFDKYHVDLVLQGHDHTYTRSGLVGTQNANTGVSGQHESGTVYVVSVSGPKMYALGANLRDSLPRVAEDTQLFQVISIQGDELTYQAKTATGRLYDKFLLKKSPGKSNVLVEMVPETPLRLRSTPPAAAK